MTRIPGNLPGPVRRPTADVYTVLLVIGILFLLVATIVVTQNLMGPYELTFGELFRGSGQLPG